MYHFGEEIDHDIYNDEPDNDAPDTESSSHCSPPLGVDKLFIQFKCKKDCTTVQLAVSCNFIFLR